MANVSVLAILAEGFEEIEAVTIIDLLRRADIQVTVAGLGAQKITGSHQIIIQCDVQLEDVNTDQFTHLFLPGGQPGSTNLKNNKTVLEFIRSFNKSQKTIGAICAAPTVLHEAGIVKNRKITSFPAEKEIFVDSIYMEEDIVHDGNIITSRGVGTAIKFALYMIGIIAGNKTSRELAQRIL
jgi:4-methyl-5(b-hydroxyethyl)-thiazole monophosphate biosynthesis